MKRISKKGLLYKLDQYIMEKFWTIIAAITGIFAVVVVGLIIGFWKGSIWGALLIILFGGIVAPATFAVTICLLIIIYIDKLNVKE